MNDYKETGCLASSEELRKLIMENPDLPIMVEVETEVCLDDSYLTWIAGSVRCRIGEVLDCDQHINEERIYGDRQQFEDDVRDWVDNSYYEPGVSDEEVEQKIEEILADYEPYWKKVIIIYAGT